LSSVSVIKSLSEIVCADVVRAIGGQDCVKFMLILITMIDLADAIRSRSSGASGIFHRTACSPSGILEQHVEVLVVELVKFLRGFSRGIYAARIVLVRTH